MFSGDEFDPCFLQKQLLSVFVESILLEMRSHMHHKCSESYEMFLLESLVLWHKVLINKNMVLNKNFEMCSWTHYV